MDPSLVADVALPVRCLGSRGGVIARMPKRHSFPFRQRQSGALGAATISNPTGRVSATSEARNIGGARADRFIAVNNERKAHTVPRAVEEQPRRSPGPTLPGISHDRKDIGHKRQLPRATGCRSATLT